MADQDFRRISSMPIDKVFKNQSSAQDWIADKFSLEPHMVHVNKVSFDQGRVKVLGQMLLTGVKSVRFELEVDL